ncbi:sugar MFS transporter [Sphingobacterium sp. HMA12]|uniref:MFS transporter n=1 Tax=Sphingobacterium sp. HMA12 TaxID=2050894 RepID=UPI000CEA1960|nr:MFS transporter [Sphingobacterium sp. HMA12]
MKRKNLLLLLVIYMAFISLGLPDSLLGSGWPAMYRALEVPLHYAGILSMIVAAGTVVSSLFSERIISRYGIPWVTTVSVLMTALALLGFSISPHFSYLCLLAIPLGLGAGCVDAALNNYVALHYAARHMNWLHCFWGVGASIGPIIMANGLANGKSWSTGYMTVGIIQISLVLLLIVSTPLWIKDQDSYSSKDQETDKQSYRKLFASSGLKEALIIFFCYCTIEATFGIWGASYLVKVRGFATDRAASMTALFYAGITIGRLISGFLAGLLNNKQLIWLGYVLIFLGLLSINLPFDITLLVGFLLVGLGCAPIFPSLLHETPQNFGENNAQAIMGIQMACAYIGITFMPLLFGTLSKHLDYSIFPWFLSGFLALMGFGIFRLNKLTENRRILMPEANIKT